MTVDDGNKVVFTTKELLQDLNTKLDRIDEKIDKKADQNRVESMVDTLKAQVFAETARAFAEIARVEALVTPLVDPVTGVYPRIEAAGKTLDGKTISALGAIVLLLAGILFKRYIGLA